MLFFTNIVNVTVFGMISNQGRSARRNVCSFVIFRAESGALSLALLLESSTALGEVPHPLQITFVYLIFAEAA
jgi:hypothetical protein